MSDDDTSDRQQKKAESRRRILESARAIFSVNTLPLSASTAT